MAWLDGIDAMKMILPKNVSLIMFFVLTSVVSCTSSITEQPDIVAIETVIPTTTLSVTPTLVNTFQTPVPNVSINTEQKMAEVLKSNDCRLPCYMGITPGVTKSSDAKILLERLGIKPVDEGISGLRYLIVIDDPLIKIFNPFYKKEQSVHNSLGLKSVDGVVQQIRIWVLAHGFSPKAQEYWSRYTPKGIFLQVGAPDAIYSGTHGGLALVYKQLGIINIYETFWKDGQLCPQNETIYFDRRFEITNPDSPDEIHSEHENALKSREIWRPIEESLGIGVQEFYDQVLTDDSVCFDIKE